MPPSGAFVGRREELAALDEELLRVRGGQPRLVWLAGDAGIGKTSLLRRFVGSVTGTTALWASGDDAETGLEYGVVEQLREELRTRRSVRAMPSQPGSGAQDPLDVGAELLAGLGALQAAGPVVLVVDDAQWVDEQSVRALVFLIRRLRRDRVLVVLGVRSGAGSGAPALWERALAQDQLVRRLSVAGLTPGELGQLSPAVSGRALPAAATRRLHEHTGGHPLYARALLEELPHAVLVDASAELPAPRSLSSLVLVRLARLSPSGQQLVLAAAVLGVRAPLSDVVALADVRDPVSALDEAIAAGLLAESRTGAVRGVEFPHQLLRTAVYADLAPARRSELHRRAANLLSGPAALAHRVAAAVGPDPRLADDLTESAVRELSQRGWRTAAGHFLAAAEVSSTPDARAARVVQAAEAMLAGGDIARALSAEPAVRAAPASAARSRVLGRLAAFTGRFDAARNEFAESLDLDGRTEGGEADRGSIATHLSLISLAEGRAEEAAELAAAALRAGPAPATAELARFVRVLALAAQGRHADALGLLGPAEPPAVRGEGDAELSSAERAALRGYLSLWSDQPEPAAAALAEVVRHPPQGMRMQARVLALSHLAEAQYRLGDWDEAAANADLAISLAEDAGIQLSAGVARAVAGHVASGRGQWEDARQRVAASAAAAAAVPWWSARAYAASSAATLAQAAGDFSAMLTALEAFDDPSVLAPVDALGVVAWRALRAEALLGLGALDSADEALVQLEARVDEQTGGWSALEAARLRAELTDRTAGRHDAAAARAAYGRAVALAAGSRARFSVARLEISYGRYLLARGERRPAADLLRAARGRLETLRAEPFLAACDESLKDAGLPPPPRGDRLRLTPQELSVAKLVAAGRTNAEVGTELFVTSRTVAYHLSNIYAKTGVTRRRDLARRLPTLLA